MTRRHQYKHSNTYEW